MNDDLDQLRRYADSGAEDAFAAVIHRYLPLVYRAALRRLHGDVHRAEDVTQMVFTALARNARPLARRSDLAGWLFTTTRYLAGRTIRTEVRRQNREQEAHMTQSLTTEDYSESASAPLHSVLDDVMMELNQVDRQVLLLRYHQGLRLAEIGERLGLTDNAVQKRMERALDRLKDMLARRGISSTAAAVALAFEQQAAVAVPAGLAAAATSAAVASTVTGGLLAVSGLVVFSKLQLGLAAIAVAATSAGVVWQLRENASFRVEMANRTVAADVRTTELKQQLAALSQRATAAEADAASLQKALQAANAARATAPRSPALTDTRERTDAAMARASKLAQEGKYQDALEEYLKCYRDLAGKQQGTLYQQMVMGVIKTLGAKFPPATVALRELRDTAMQKLQANPGVRELVSEIALLNERLDDGRASMALYDTLPPGDPGRQALGLIAHKSFVEARRYADALVGKSFGSMMNEMDMNMKIRASGGLSSQSLANNREFAINGTLTNIEALTGAGQLEDARVLTEKLLAYDGSEATRAALKRHVARATQPLAP